MKVSRKAGANNFRQNHSTTVVISLVVVHGEEVKFDAQVVMKLVFANDERGSTCEVMAAVIIN